MKRFLSFPILIGGLLLFSCGGKPPSQTLIVSEAAHFMIQGNGTALNLPIFAGTLGVDEIVRDVTLAEYYYDKLSAVYNFQAFNFMAANASEYLLDRPGSLIAPQTIYAYDDSVSHIELLLVSYSNHTAQYLFRISDKRTGQVRDHTVEVPNGKSASIGLLFDKEHNRGHLISISMDELEMTPQVTPDQLADFLRQKNTPRGQSAPAGFKPGDQRWMDELFGERAIRLPVEPPPQPDEAEDDVFIPMDVPPSPIGGMQAITTRVIYPETARRDSIVGQVIVQAYIDKEGHVKRLKVAKSVRADLDSAAVNAIREVQFTPAQNAGQPVGVWIAIPVMFKLQNK